MLDAYLTPGTPEFEAYVQWTSFVARVGETPGGRYLPERGIHALGARLGFPPGLSGMWWTAVKAMREPAYTLPLRDEQGTPFRLTLPSFMNAVFPVVNADSAAVMYAANRFERAPVPQEIVFENLRREAVASCLLDGVPVDRDIALEMLESGREPRSRAERAVWNVHRALLLPIRRNVLTPEVILELHRTLLEGAAEDPGAAGRLRSAGEAPAGPGAAPPDVAAPSAAELQERLEALCAFMDPDRTEGRRHDIVEALLMQFWVAYERPFVEANGRLARVLHYARLHARSYWTPVSAQVSLSWTFARAPSVYADAFRDARVDSNDTGYFIHAGLRVLKREVRRLLRFIHGARQMARMMEARGTPELNERQLEVLWTLRTRPDPAVSIEVHRRRHGTVYQTARTDLLALKELGLLEQARAGKAFVFTPSKQLLALPLPPDRDDLEAHERRDFSALAAMFRSPGKTAEETGAA